MLKAHANTGLNEKMAKCEKGSLSVEKLEEAEAAIILLCQSASFMDEMIALKKRLSV